MVDYSQYASHLENLIEQSDWGRKVDVGIDYHYDLNGGAAKALKKLVDNHHIRASGAYFTGEALAREAISKAIELRTELTAFDPTCGAGDLLLRWAETLPVERSLERTLSNWGRLLAGYDIHQAFIDVTKRRLTLCAISRGAQRTGKPLKIDSQFPLIRRRDFLKDSSEISAETILLNPPFRQIKCENSFEWAGGQVSQAAMFFVKCLEQKDDKKIVSILPDVLRSGARYEKWRKLVSERMGCAEVSHEGAFGNGVDIDVFVLNGLLKSNSDEEIKWSPNTTEKTTLGSFCDVRIGSVVPHRHSQKGPWTRYYTAKDLPVWAEIEEGPKRRVQTSLLKPPFLAVRRTSSPSDRRRPLASLVKGDAEVALENHLIGIRPNDGKLSTCRLLLKSLQNPATRTFLDNEIRCRHLTVGALKKLPLFK